MTNKIITIVKAFIWNKCLLHCSECGTVTVHALSKDGAYYSCGCGTCIDIEYKEEE